MRLFDITGILAVTAWVALTGLYVYRHEFEPDGPDATALDDEVVLQEGENWLILQRDGEDVGFVHRTRTRLEEGWLMEYELLMVLELLGETRPIEVGIKGRLDEDAYLREADADIEAAGRTISAQVDVDGEQLSLVINPGSEPIQRTITLRDRPRLATHSFNQIVSRENLKPGDRFENDYFDPTSLGMKSIEMEYIGRETVDVFGEQYDSLHVKQHVAGETYDVYLDDRGELLVQEFPLEMVGARVDPSLGRARASNLRRRAAEADSGRDGSSPPLEGAGMRTALEMLGIGSEGFTEGEDGSSNTLPSSLDDLTGAAASPDADTTDTSPAPDTTTAAPDAGR